MDSTTLLVLSVMLGLIVGSFLNVVIVRYPKMLVQRWQKDCMEYLKQPVARKPSTYHLITPRSQCPKCHKQLKIWHNIPIISYLFLRGRCAFCQKSISLLYPTVELITAVITIFVMYYFGLTWEGSMALIFSWSLIALAFIDLREQILPDDITLSLLWIGLLTNTAFFYTTPRDAIVGAVVGYVLLWVVAKLFALIRKKEGMGHGDFKMLAMVGAWVGMSMLLNALLVSVFIALAISLLLIALRKLSKNNLIPFGTYLALGGWLTFMFGPTLTNWIARILQSNV